MNARGRRSSSGAPAGKRWPATACVVTAPKEWPDSPTASSRKAAQGAVAAQVIDPAATPTPESSFELVFDAVGSALTRQTAIKAVKPGGVVLHIGLLDWASEIDMRKLTLAEITLLGTYTYSMADLRATVAALARGVFGDLSWVERRPLAEGARAFDDLHVDAKGVTGAKGRNRAGFDEFRDGFRLNLLNDVHDLTSSPSRRGSFHRSGRRSAVRRSACSRRQRPMFS